ncbi:bifunctional UDP-sugar hydrolase/5'-nucleotidase UshA [Thorsellia kenyensis]|uniref:Bifunctional UDP-sugar hydrolase/5'-nucleotidase UshA n=1 Tax=Thorsellia kenyensis TaxID=1549888 RepID=A0ABV6C6D3_9GAMM
MTKLKKRKLITTLAVSLGVSLLPHAVLAYEKDKTYHFTIIHTNDHHGSAWANDKGEMGLAARMTVINSIKKEIEAKGGSVLILDAGDINTGVPESDLLMAEPDIKGMNLIGYEAMTIGNHEFDNPKEVLDKQQSWAEFPFLSANIYDKKSGDRVFKPFEIFDKQGLKIAVVGLTTEDTAKVGNPLIVGDYEFKKPVEEAPKVLKELESYTPDITIALSHQGYYENGNFGSNAPGDVTMARTLESGSFDFIIGGHSHDAVCMLSENKLNMTYNPTDECQPDFQNGSWIMQTLDLGKYVGRADISFLNGNITLDKYELIPVNLTEKVKNEAGDTSYVVVGETVKPAKEMVELLTPYYEKGQEKLAVKVGEVDNRLEGERDKVRFGQTNLGQLLLNSLTERTNADVAVLGGGGIRASIDAGNITYKDILKVQPFGNTVVYIDFTGKELKEYLAVAASKKTDSGAYAHFSNVSFKINPEGTLSDVTVKGEPLDETKLYRLATLNFISSGGDGYPVISDKSGFVDTGFVDAEVLKAYVEKHSPLKASELEPKFMHQPL